MIQPTELRTGNYVYYKKEEPKYIFKITGVVDDKTDTEEKVNGVYEYWDAGYDKEDILPILITPDIIEKAGFYKKDSDVFILPLNEEDDLMWLDCNDIYLNHNRAAVRLFGHIKYVHQLQNLYHALTGEELDITLVASEEIDTSQ